MIGVWLSVARHKNRASIGVHCMTETLKFTRDERFLDVLRTGVAAGCAVSAFQPDAPAWDMTRAHGCRPGDFQPQREGSCQTRQFVERLAQ